MFARTLALYVIAATCTTAQVLWQEPPPLSSSDWVWGPGGMETAPQPPFRFVKEKFGGTNPKVEVKDDRGRRWIVKFGSESHTDTFQSRLVSSLGYAAEPVYFVKAGSILDMHDLKRAKHFVAKDGSFREARFKIQEKESQKDTSEGAWSWAVNPFVGTRELGGLKILAMLTSNWDTKDSRNGEGSNTGIIRVSTGKNPDARYAVTDWGASLGRAGFIFKRNRWDWEGYRLETSNFVRLGSDGRLRWRYKGRHGDDITAGVSVEDVRWILRYLSRITDDDLKTGLAASGASGGCRAGVRAIDPATHRSTAERGAISRRTAGGEMKLLIEPEAGADPLIKEIDGAKKSIEIAIFRFDHEEVKNALERAVDRGVAVHALIANTSHGDEKGLRKLEMELLPAGIEVSRTADDLLRHHYKFMIVDRRVLYILTFNYTHLDIEHSRSFALVIDDPEAVEEASRLFYADVRRQPYKPELKSFVVSPLNAREQLSHFIKGAEKQLLIYDPEVSDRAMIRLLRDRARQGVEIRIIGRVVKPSADFDPGHLMRMRFHTRTILRDRREAFLGSQSLREHELDRRRELGMFVRDHDIVHSLVKVFESDWAGLEPAREGSVKEKVPESAKALKKTVKAIVRELPLTPIVEDALKHAVGKVPNFDLHSNELRHNLTDVVKNAVEEAVSGIVRKSSARA